MPNQWRQVREVAKELDMDANIIFRMIEAQKLDFDVALPECRFVVKARDVLNLLQTKKKRTKRGKDEKH